MPVSKGPPSLPPLLSSWQEQDIRSESTPMSTGRFTPLSPGYSLDGLDHERVWSAPLSARRGKSLTPRAPASPMKPGSVTSARTPRLKQSVQSVVSEQAKAKSMINAWWANVENSMQSRRVEQLQLALKEVNGASYMATIKAVRRCAALTVEERHRLETDISARLVSARALLGKWQSGLQEIREAREARDVDLLSEALEKWRFDKEDPEIATAHADLTRWRTLTHALPPVLQEAVVSLNIQQIQECMSALSGKKGPERMDGLEDAQRMLKRYNAQCKMLREAVAAGKVKDIQAAVQAWEFDKQDEQLLLARSSLVSREEQKAQLQAAIASLNGNVLQAACDAWSFDRDEPFYLEARKIMERYFQAADDLMRLTQALNEFPALVQACQAWKFSKDDDVWKAALARRQAWEGAARDCLDAEDGWALAHHWHMAGQGAAWRGSFQQPATDFLHLYKRFRTDLLRALKGSESSSLSTEMELLRRIKDWTFSQEDPIYEAACLWTQILANCQADHLRSLDAISCGGYVPDIKAALKRGRNYESSVEVQDAMEICDDFEQALGAVGSLALGIPPEKLKEASAKFAMMEEKADNIRKTVETLEVSWLSRLRTLQRPPRIIWGLLEMIMHVTAGLNPAIHNPPRDTDWRSCQRMLVNPEDFHAHMALVPEWLAAGHIEGVERAAATASNLQVELAEAWSYEAASETNFGAACLYRYLEHVFVYAEIIAEDQPEEQAEDEEKEAAADAATALQVDVPTAEEEAKFEEDRQAWALEATRWDSDHAGRTMTMPGGHSRDMSKSSAKFRSSWNSEDVQFQLVEYQRQESFAQPIEMLREPLTVMERARMTLGSSILLSAAWIVAGGDKRQLDRCREAVDICCAQTMAVSTVHGQVITALVGSAQQKRRNSLVLRSAFTGLATLNQDDDFLSPRNESRGDSKSAASTCNEDDADEDWKRFGMGRMPTDMSLPEDDARRDSHGHRQVSGTVVRQLQSAAMCLASCRQEDLLQRAPDGRPAGEAAAWLLFGMGGDEFMSSQYRSVLKARMGEALRLTVLVVCDWLRPKAANDREAATWSTRIAGDLLRLTQKVIKSLRVPHLNLAAARRALLTTSERCPPPPAVVEFVQAMHAFYLDFVPQRTKAAAAEAAASLAEEALRETDQRFAFARTLRPMHEPPPSSDLADVRKASELAAAQVATLSKRGLPLPAVHVEFVRQVVDGAGAHLLARLPAADPAARLRWSEQAMALQLAPMPYFKQALADVASALSSEALALFGSQKAAPGPECVKLFSAVFWIVEPDCKCDADWKKVAAVLAPRTRRTSKGVWDKGFWDRGLGGGFLERLILFEPEREAVWERLARAEHLLAEIWDWMSHGCSGNGQLSVMYAWALLVTSLKPLLQVTRSIQPVHRELLKGIERVEQAPPEQQAAAKMKAWTVALFLLDGPGESWWWLRFIRPAAQCRPPWTDADDGGVGAAPWVENEVALNGTQSDSFDVKEDSWKDDASEEAGADVEDSDDDSKWPLSGGHSGHGSLVTEKPGEAPS